MTQGVLPFQYENERTIQGMTAAAGLPLYLELAHVLGMVESVRKRLTARQGTQGWTDCQVVMAIILLNVAGGTCVDDLDRLEADEGFKALLRRAELNGLPRAQRRDLERRWRKARDRAVPSPTAVFRYLESYHDPEQEGLRTPGKAFIPKPNDHLKALPLVNADFLAFLQSRSPQTQATLDCDATVSQTSKADALPCYKGYKAYQPLNVWWAEQGVMLHTEFRDGNVPAGFDLLRVLQEALDLVPPGVTKIRLRSDTAGYQHDLMKYCAEGKHPRFGVIEFAIGCDVTPQFKNAVAEVPEADWKPCLKGEGVHSLPTKREWAEVCFVPAGMGFSKKTTPYRYVATRELMDQPPLPGMEAQQRLPFQTMQWGSNHYKLHGIATNMRLEAGWSGNKVIDFLYERCGKSEEVHAVLKSDLAGGHLPCAEFGKNAAWWWMTVLAHNLNAAMKRLVLGGPWVVRRLKAVRFHLIHVAGRVMERGRRLLVRLAGGADTLALFLAARRKMLELARARAAPA